MHTYRVTVLEQLQLLHLTSLSCFNVIPPLLHAGRVG